jgi:uncharacterized membrane protein (UPF0136 family)
VGEETASMKSKMNTETAGNLLVFGIFIMLLGVAGYMTHPERAQTALISGTAFGALSVLWGILGAKGVRWSRPAALGSTFLLAAACVWRASLSWLAVAGGQSDKRFASVIITLMLAVSAAMLFLLLRDRRTGGAEASGGAHDEHSILHSRS